MKYSLCFSLCGLKAPAQCMWLKSYLRSSTINTNKGETVELLFLKCACIPVSQHVSVSLDSGNRLSDHCWFLFSVLRVSKATGKFSYYLTCQEEESTSTRTDVGVNKKGFPNLWNDVQHVSYINIYLKYKSILLLLKFGFFYIEDTMLRGGGALWGRRLESNLLVTSCSWGGTLCTDVSFTIPVLYHFRVFFHFGGERSFIEELKVNVKCSVQFFFNVIWVLFLFCFFAFSSYLN